MSVSGRKTVLISKDDELRKISLFYKFRTFKTPHNHILIIEHVPNDELLREIKTYLPMKFQSLGFHQTAIFSNLFLEINTCISIKLQFLGFHQTTIFSNLLLEIKTYLPIKLQSLRFHQTAIFYK